MIFKEDQHTELKEKPKSGTIVNDREYLEILNYRKLRRI